MPEWYFLPFYAILRAITFNIGPINSKLGGVLAMFGVDRRAVPGALARHVEGALGGLPAVVQAVLLAVRRQRDLARLAGLAPGGRLVRADGADLATLYYFVFFLVIMPLLGLIETPRRMPNSITEAVLEKNKGGAVALPVGAAASPERKG